MNVSDTEAVAMMRIRRCTNIDCLSHVNAHAEVFAVSAGTVNVTVNGTKFAIRAGESAVVAPFESHAFASEGESDAVVYMFNGDLFADFCAEVAKRDYKNRKIALTCTEKETFFSDVPPQGYDRDVNDALTAHALIYPLLFRVIGQNSTLTPDGMGRDFMTDAMRYLLENHTSEITLSTLCEQVGVSYVYLSRTFKERTGVGFSEMLCSLRLNSALALLLCGEKTVSEVAYECGFGSLRNFNRAFLRYTGTTPSRYRKDKQ